MNLIHKSDLKTFWKSISVHILTLVIQVNLSYNISNNKRFSNSNNVL